jgi:hypothetical protein
LNQFWYVQSECLLPIYFVPGIAQNLDEEVRIPAINSDIAQVVQNFFPAELEQAKSRNVVIVVD